jgi:hypothetical protein
MCVGMCKRAESLESEKRQTDTHTHIHIRRYIFDV